MIRLPKTLFAMRIYASVMLLGLLTGFLPVASQLTPTDSTVHLKAAVSSQLLAVTQTSQEGDKRPYKDRTGRPQRRMLS